MIARWPIAAAARALGCVAIVSTAGCSGSPSLNILGSFFPAWMLCAIGGLALAIVVKLILTALRVGPNVPAPLVVYLSLSAAFAFALWLVWLG